MVEYPRFLRKLENSIEHNLYIRLSLFYANRITGIKSIVKIRYSYYTKLGNCMKKKAAK